MTMDFNHYYDELQTDASYKTLSLHHFCYDVIFLKINVITNNVWNDVMDCVGREHAWSRGREKRLKPTGGVWNDVIRDVIMTSCVEPSRETGGREKRLKPTGGENL